MFYYRYWVSNGYAGCGYEDVIALETPDEIEDFVTDRAQDNAEEFEYVATGWDEDFETERDREEYYENALLNSTWEEISQEEYEEYENKDKNGGGLKMIHLFDFNECLKYLRTYLDRGIITGIITIENRLEKSIFFFSPPVSFENPYDDEICSALDDIGVKLESNIRPFDEEAIKYDEKLDVEIFYMNGYEVHWYHNGD